MMMRKFLLGSFATVCFCLLQTNISTNMYETVTETEAVKPATTNTVKIPATYTIKYRDAIVQSETRVNFGSEKRSIWRLTPAMYKRVATKYVLAPHFSEEVRIPAITKQVTRRALKTQ